MKDSDSTTSAILRIPESVRDDTRAYRVKVERFIKGEAQSVAFRAYRVPMGVYEQRQADTYMVRTRLGAGLVLPSQLERIASLSQTFGNGILHVTTRQAIQIHQVRIEDTPAVLEGLMEVGISSRGGGGNTVRNATACPGAGTCPQEVFDVSGHAVAVAEYLIQDRSSFNLPRKYKIVFSGCPQDCANASVADLGFFAHMKDGRKGFAVYGAGGLGGSPRVGIRLEDFIEEQEIFLVAEAIKRLFDKHGDRSNKLKARLRFVLERVGEAEFQRLYQAERAQLSEQGLVDPVPEIRDLNAVFDRDVAQVGDPELPPELDVLPEKHAGLHTVRLHLDRGDITAQDLAVVASLARQYARGFVRGTQNQNLLISSVPAGNLRAVADQLKELNGSVKLSCKTTIVSCTGAATCKLGLCLSQGLAEAIAQKLTTVDLNDSVAATTIRISGCPNSCGHHYLGDIGLQGRARRIKDRLMPVYDVLAGAHIAEDQAQLAHPIGSVPAKRIPDLLAEAFAAGDLSEARLTSLVETHGQLGPDQIPESYYYDFGSTEPFSLAGRGPGECGAGVMDVIVVDINQAREALQAARTSESLTQRSEHLYHACLCACRSLLVIFGLEPAKDREVLAAFTKHVIEAGWVSEQTRTLLDAVMDWRMGDTPSLVDQSECIDQLISRIGVLFRSLDANLQFTTAPLYENTPAADAVTSVEMTDLRGVACPLNFVKAKLALEKIDVGQILEVLLDAGEPIRNVPASFAQQGQDVIETKALDDHFVVRVRRVK